MIGLEKTYYPVSEGTIGDVEICVTVYRPFLGCPIQFPFTLILKAVDGTAGICSQYIVLCIMIRCAIYFVLSGSHGLLSKYSCDLAI